MPDWLVLPLPWYDVSLRLIIAVTCGAIVGMDREQRGRAAGLRTHMMVALGSATFALVGVCLYETLESRGPNQASGHALRTISAVVGGIGFIGAGTIIHSSGKVRGLTTAAGMWTVASIGVASGVGFHLLAIMVTALAFITLAVLSRWETVIKPDDDRT